MNVSWMTGRNMLQSYSNKWRMKLINLWESCSILYIFSLLLRALECGTVQNVHTQCHCHWSRPAKSLCSSWSLIKGFFRRCSLFWGDLSPSLLNQDSASVRTSSGWSLSYLGPFLCRVFRCYICTLNMCFMSLGTSLFGTIFSWKEFLFV